MKRTLCLLALLMLTAGTAGAHGIDHFVYEGASRTIEVMTNDGLPFSFESYEVFGPDDRAPHQIGRTDKHGRVSFVPDRPGDWTVKVWSEDGHGLTATVAVADLEVKVTEPQRGASPRRVWGLAIGLLVIAAGGWALTRSRRQDG